jgi:diadenosine tetraphosphate (Ap4A) HIT family hydrolase
MTSPNYSADKKMTCVICDRKKEDDNDNVIYENDNILIMLAENPSVSGHLQIFPKRHITIMEQLTSEESEHVINAANKVSMILFEALKVHGTNIVIQNGTSAGQAIPHFSVNIIPRRTDDGLSLDWDMKQASNDSLESMQRIISEGINYEDKPYQSAFHDEIPADTMREDIVNGNSDNNEQDTTNGRKDGSDEKKEDKDVSKKKTNYWLKSLERIP